MFKNRYLAFSAAAVFAVTPVSPFAAGTPWGHSPNVTAGHKATTGPKAHWGGITPVHVQGPGQHTGTPTPTPKPTPTKTTPPPTGNFSNNIVPKVGTLMGAYPKAGHGGVGVNGAVTALEQAEGRKLDIDHHYLSFGSPLPDTYAWDVAQGRIPMVSWAGQDTDEIAAGKWDSLIISRAKEIKALKAPFLVRFMWEMDGAPNEAHFVMGTQSYINAWRRVVTIFRQQGATNAQFVWCPTAYGFRPNGGRGPSFYPGDNYVDWVAADGYNWAPGRGGNYASFQSVFANFYDWAKKNTPNKPLLIGETGVQERNPGDKAKWIAAMGQTIKTVYPNIKAVVYFNSNPKYPWWLDSTGSSMSAWTTLLHDPYFNTRYK
jgi:hypothetical protein